MRWLRGHGLAADVLTAVAFMLLDTATTLVGVTWWPAHPGTLAWTMLGLQAVADASLAFRRRAPMIVIAILAGFTLAITLLISPAGLLTPADHGNIWAPFGTVLAAYGPFYYRNDRRMAFAAVGTLTLIVARVWQPSAEIITLGILRTAVGPLLALYFTARAEAQRSRRRQLVEQTRADERARLAGEMHDVVTHRVSLMVLQAGALSITATDAATRQAAEELRAAGVQALDELRDLVGILHTEPDGDQSPSVSGLPALVAESSAVGTPAELVEDGDPALASPVVGRTAYRVVREALTNARKHAPGSQVLVRVSYGESRILLTVSNSAPPARPASQIAVAGSALAATGSGLGLAGLRQRIELVHGTLAAGPTPDGGFRLEVTLPSFVPTAARAEPAA
jgi:signal transduction histidine kinase